VEYVKARKYEEVENAIINEIMENSKYPALISDSRRDFEIEVILSKYQGRFWLNDFEKIEPPKPPK
jgi:hypothetical protein